MSSAAVMLVKDEADVVAYTVRHLLGQVDEVVVSDNGSTDGTLDVLRDLAGVYSELSVTEDPDPAYYQAEKTTRLAREALERGHRWVVPCDADELWYATDGRRIADFLDGLAPDVVIVTADLYNHLPTGADPVCGRCGGAGDDPDDGEACGVCLGSGVTLNPFVRIGWRQREHGALPKVACRLRPSLEIRQGNHSAYAPGSGIAVPGLCVRHFSWRSPGQYQTKIANGYRAYAATSLPEEVGAHWRMFGDPDEPSFAERVQAHYRQWFYVDDPHGRPDLIYDPAPYTVSDRRDIRPGDGVCSDGMTVDGDAMEEHAAEAVAVTDAGSGVRRHLEDALELAQGFGLQDDALELDRRFLELKIEEALLWARKVPGT